MLRIQNGGLSCRQYLLGKYMAANFTMKTWSNLWNEFTSYSNIRKAVDKACKGKCRQRSVQRVKADKDYYARETQYLLLTRKFHTSSYRRFMQHYPKDRWIYVLPVFPDRIVHHATMQVLTPVLLKLFIKDSYSAIPDKGQTQASTRCAELTRRFDWCLDCDIRHYHENMNMRLLSDMLHKHIKDGRFMEVVDDILFSLDWCPTGNYPSQWWTNVYLTPFDNFVRHILRCHGYVRYADNFLLFTNDRRQAEQWQGQVWKFLKDYNLEASHSVIRRCSQGVYFVGYRHFKKHVLIRKSTAKRQKSYIHKCSELGYNNIQSMRSWDSHACTYNFRKRHGIDRLCKELKDVGMD